MTFDKIKEAVMGELKNTFKPEFLNRIDDIIVFSRLNKDNIRSIADKMLGEVSKRVAETAIGLSFTSAAADKIADVGFDEVYGARPLRRAVRTNIEDKLSELMLEGKVQAGRKYLCDVKDGEFTFTEDENTDPAPAENQSEQSE